MTDKPSDDLRTRIARAIYNELLETSDGYVEGQEGTWTVDPTVDEAITVDCRITFTELADAVIRELASDCATGCMWQIPNHFEDMTEQQRTILSAQRSIDESADWGIGTCQKIYRGMSCPTCRTLYTMRVTAAIGPRESSD